MLDAQSDFPNAVAANLPAQIVNQFGSHSADISRQIDELLAPIASHRDTIREHLLQKNQILPLPPIQKSEQTLITPLEQHIPNTEPQKETPLVVTDGALITQSMYACDLIGVVAAAANGITPYGGNLAHESQALVIPRTPHRDTVARLLMFSLELEVFSRIEAPIKGLDGALGTALLGVLTGLSQAGDLLTDPALEQITERVTRGIIALTPSESTTIALPKADTSSTLAQKWSKELNIQLPPMDRVLATQILEPGEYLSPSPATAFKNVNHGSAISSTRLQTHIQRLDKALQQLRDLSEDTNTAGFTFMKPHRCNNTVLKVEYIAPNRNFSLEETLHAIDHDTVGPHLQEPFAQYVADLAVKSVSVGIEALRSNLIDQLPQDAPYIPYLTRDYRTTKGK